ncbi:hypothetical protein MTP99_014140 [Tenebrio molitor]|nr:hypothetical protein MTP99_014140 [Tenebrio molitor]
MHIMFYDCAKIEMSSSPVNRDIKMAPPCKRTKGDGEEFFDLRNAATKNIDVGLDTLVISQHSSHRSRPANPQTDPLQNVRTFLQPSEQFEQKDHRMLHASIEQRLQTNLTEHKTLRTPTRRICTIQHEDYILQESALHSLQKRRVNIIYRRPYKGGILEPGCHIGDIQKLQGRDFREFPASTQNKTQCPEGSPRYGPNVLIVIFLDYLELLRT